MENPIYLHFFDRELRTTERADFSDQSMFQYSIIATLLSPEYVYVSNSILTESSITYPNTVKLISELEKTGLARFISSTSSIDEFLASREKLYFHDKDKYPMYFNPSNVPWGSHPIIINDSTTSILKKNFLLWTLDENKNDILFSKMSQIESIIKQKEQKAITLNLFKNNISLTKDEELCLARLISTFYTNRYLDLLNGTLLLRVPNLAYYDRLAVNKDYDYPVYYKLFNSLFLQNILQEQNIEKIVETIYLTKLNHDFQYFIANTKNCICNIFQNFFNEKESIYLNRLKSETFIYNHIINKMSSNKKMDFNQMSAQIDYLKKTLETKYNIKFDTNMDEEKKKVLYVVATDTELRNVLEYYKSIKINPTHFSLSAHTYWNLGHINNSIIYLLKTGMGSKGQGGAILGIDDAIRSLDPDYIIMLGICFGLKEDKHQLKDILVANILQDYEHSKIDDITITPRGERIPSDLTLIDRFSNSAAIWDDSSAIHIGLVLTGEKLSNSKIFIETLKKQFPDAIGGEMEGSGLLSSAHRGKKGWILVKGICDWGYNKDDESQREAAINAIKYVHFTLSEFEL